MAKRKNGCGGLSLRKDGRWEGRIVIGYDEKGLPKTRNVLAKTKTECQAKLDTLRESLGSSGQGKLKPDMRFSEWIDFWYRTYSKPGLRPTTQGNYENMIYKHIIPELGAIALDKLTSVDLQKFCSHMKTSGRQYNTDHYGTGLSDRTVRACLAVCSISLKRAVVDKLIRINPADNVKLPPKKAKEMKILTHDEMQRFLMQAKAEGYFELFLLELTTGMRRGEVLALEWRNVSLETGEVWVHQQVQRIKGELTISEPKTKSSIRTIILTPAVCNVLSKLKETNTSKWLFPSPLNTEKPRDTRACAKRMKLILERSGCKNLRFHDLRHTFSTTALEHGMDVKTLSAIIGHISAATTLDIYSHITNEMQLQAAESIERSIGNSETVHISETEQKPKQNIRDYKPSFGKKRRSGTGCVSQINENLWEGRYSQKVDGKRKVKTVYAHSEDECEVKLAELIQSLKKS